MDDLDQHLAQILTPELCLSVYHLKFPFAKQNKASGAVVGQFQFGGGSNMHVNQWVKPFQCQPSTDPFPICFRQAFYDLIFHSAILPLSKIPLDKLLAFDLKKLLLDPSASEYPEHCLGMVQILDQSRTLMTGYGFRYTRSFFDPLCEKFVRQLIALPNGIRPDNKRVWLSRGYSFDDWIVRVLWFWAPLVHSDTFMTADRQHLKDWLHYIRSEVESYYSAGDPFAHLEASDDVDVTLFDKIVTAGPPLKSYADPDAEATISDYAFWYEIED